MGSRRSSAASVGAADPPPMVGQLPSLSRHILGCRRIVGHRGNGLWSTGCSTCSNCSSTGSRHVDTPCTGGGFRRPRPSDCRLFAGSGHGDSSSDRWPRPDDGRRCDVDHLAGFSRGRDGACLVVVLVNRDTRRHNQRLNLTRIFDHYGHERSEVLSGLPKELNNGRVYTYRHRPLDLSLPP